jgi:hypothetical protein
MKQMLQEQWELLFSQYIDGILSKEDQAFVEERLKSDTSAQAYVEELRRLKSLLGSKEKLTPDIGFATRFSVALEEQKKEDHNLLPFPRRYMPAMTALAAVVLVVTGVFLNRNRAQFSQFFSEKSQVVKEVYEKNVVQGSLLPFFSKVNKDQALQFSLFGSLSLDDKTETALRVDEQAKKGYRIEVGKDSKHKTKSMTFNKFLAEVNPTSDQRKIIDSLLELTGKRIESSVLMGENNSLAIAPDLPKLNKVMLTNIASCLEPVQRVRFERMLEAHDAPYSVAGQNAPSLKREQILNNVPRMPSGDRFVIITPDTTVMSQLHIDLNGLRKQMEENIVMVELRRNAMLKHMITRKFQHMPPNTPVPAIVGMPGEEEFFSVEINMQGEDSGQQQMHIVVQPRLRRHGFTPPTTGHPLEVRSQREQSRMDSTLP